jgi:alpha-maltose-1-phosphate synthase
MRPRDQAAVFFTNQDFHMEQKELKGRHSAGNSFLRGLMHYTAFSDVVAASYPNSLGDTWRKALGSDADIRPVRWISSGDIKALSQVGCIYLPGPNFERFTYMRMYDQPRSFSICGITHTTASCLQLFTSLPIMPLFSWDALICTSTAVRDTLRTVLEDASRYFAWRFGANRTPLPQLPLIPLGVVADDYVYSSDDRAVSRTALGLGEDETAVLFLGRLSFHAKVNPAPMFLALEETARATGHKVTLILCGWFYNKVQEDAFREGVEALAPSIRVVILDGREADRRKSAWSAADIFCSLSDNIQETFGLTPLEAMAAGLPVVVSDWDGYRDTVRHGVDGFRIRTMTPAPPFGSDLAFRFASGLISYDYYLSQTSQVTNIDLDECISAIRTLVESPELRRKMGEAGRRRASEIFDWRHIIQQYEELWAELAERRRADAEPSTTGAPRNMPEYPDPFHAFGTYATEMLSDRHVVRLRIKNPVDILEARSKLVLYQHGLSMCLDLVRLRAMLENLQECGPTTVETLAGRLPSNMRGRVIFSVLWCAKMGLLQVDSPQQATGHRTEF